MRWWNFVWKWWYWDVGWCQAVSKVIGLKASHIYLSIYSVVYSAAFCSFKLEKVKLVFVTVLSKKLQQNISRKIVQSNTYHTIIFSQGPWEYTRRLSNKSLINNLYHYFCFFKSSSNEINKILLHYKMIRNIHIYIPI